MVTTQKSISQLYYINRLICFIFLSLSLKKKAATYEKRQKLKHNECNFIKGTIVLAKFSLIHLCITTIISETIDEKTTIN